MNWQEVCGHLALQNLPFKIELNRQGQVLMSPVRMSHSIYQGEILRILNQLLSQGKAFPEAAIQTQEGTKVADVVWCSLARLNKIKEDTEAHIAPEICVEVLSASNTKEEMEMKRKLYFEKGAQEVWICDEAGQLCFYEAEGSLEISKMVPKFPLRIEI